METARNFGTTHLNDPKFYVSDDKNIILITKGADALDKNDSKSIHIHADMFYCHDGIALRNLTFVTKKVGCKNSWLHESFLRHIISWQKLFASLFSSFVWELFVRLTVKQGAASKAWWWKLECGTNFFCLKLTIILAMSKTSAQLKGSECICWKRKFPERFFSSKPGRRHKKRVRGHPPWLAWRGFLPKRIVTEEKGSLRWNMRAEGRGYML